MSSRTRSSSSSLEDAGGDSSHERQVSVVTATGRRTKPLTAEEKVLRRRLQYKLHQRRHRAKQKETILELEQEVTALTETISRLQYEKQTLEKQSVFSSRGLRSGAPTKVAMEYLRVFEHGFNPHKSAMQEQFLRAVMDTTVGGPDYEGIDTLMVQWRRYSMFFLRTQYIPHNIVQVSVVDDMTVVVIDVTMNIQSTRDGLLVLYPNVNGREHIIQHMLSQPLVVPGSLRFTFDHRGVVTWFGTDMDFVAGLQRTLGSLEDVSTCMQDAQISFCTGQIQVSAEPKWAAAPRGCVHEEIELTC